MPPTPHQTVMDRFHASRSRADDLLLKLRVKRVVDTLKQNKGELYRVENELVEKGLLEQLPMHSTKPAAPLKAIKDGNADDDSGDDADDTKEFNRNINCFRDLPFNIWGKSLQISCPEIMTKANIAALRKRGQRVTSLKSIQEIGEFIADVSPDDSICTTMRCKKKVVDFLVARMRDRKYRFEKLILPINYNKQGPYYIKNLGGSKVEATLRWTGKTVLITVPINSKVIVDIPFSTLRATLRIEGKDWSKMLWPLFSTEVDTITKVLGNQKRILHLNSMKLRRRIGKKSTAPAVAGPYSSPEASTRFRATSPATGKRSDQSSAVRKTSGDDDLDGDDFDDSGYIATQGDVGCEGRPAGPSSGKGVGGGSHGAMVPTESSIAALVHTLWASTKSKIVNKK